MKCHTCGGAIGDKDRLEAGRDDAGFRVWNHYACIHGEEWDLEPDLGPYADDVRTPGPCCECGESIHMGDRSAVWTVLGLIHESCARHIWEAEEAEMADAFDVTESPWA